MMLLTLHPPKCWICAPPYQPWMHASFSRQTRLVTGAGWHSKDKKLYSRKYLCISSRKYVRCSLLVVRLLTAALLRVESSQVLQHHQFLPVGTPGTQSCVARSCTGQLPA